MKKEFTPTFKTKVYLKEGNKTFILIDNKYKYLIVADPYRTNTISLTEGSYDHDIVLIGPGRPMVAYIRIKYPWSYFKRAKEDTPTLLRYWDLGKTGVTY